MSEPALYVMSTERALGIGRRMQKLESLVTELHGRLTEERQLRDTALIELARERGARDTMLFRRRWLQEHRPTSEVPIYRPQAEGEGA